MNKNEFALKCKNKVNEYINNQGGSPIKEANFDSNGNRLFFHEDDDGNFSVEEMINWFNILMNDPDNFFEGSPIGDTDSTLLIHKGKELGFITENTQKYW